MAPRRLSCVTSAMSSPSIRMRPPSRSWKAQQQVHQRRLAGARTAHEPDLLARTDPQRQAVDQPRLAAIAEADRLEADLAARHVELGRIRAVAERDRPGDGHHALLDRADILEDVGDLDRDPAGRGRDLPRQGDRHRHDADVDPAALPQENRERRLADQHHGVHGLQRHEQRREHPHLPPERHRVAVHHVAHVAVLVAQPCEELQGQDVGVAVDDAPDHERACLRGPLRAVAQPRYDDPQHHRIGREPERDRQHQQHVDPAEQRQGRDAVDRDAPDGRDAGDSALPHRGARFHDARRDTAGKIVLEEGPALAHDMPMALPAHHVGDVDHDPGVRDQVLGRDGGRPREQHHERHRGQKGAVESEERLARRRRDGAHEPPDEPGHGSVEHRYREARREEGCEQQTGLPDEVPVEARETFRGLNHGAVGGRRDDGFEQAEHAGVRWPEGPCQVSGVVMLHRGSSAAARNIPGHGKFRLVPTGRKADDRHPLHDRGA